MDTLIRLVATIPDALASLPALARSDLTYIHRRDAGLFAILFLLVTGGALIARHLIRPRPGRASLTIPALLSARDHKVGVRWLAPTRHGAWLVFLAGLPFFGVALSAPQTALIQEETRFPGHRITILIDASLSMDSAFSTQTLRAGNTFLANVAAAEYFVRRRMDGPYHDLVSLIQFGSQAYIVTPFTNDYENILLSIALIGTPEEYDRFPDHGTLIMGAINRAVQLFRTFDFLQASGNLIVIFSDGQDTHAVDGDLTLDQILQQASENEIPVYFIRTSYDRELGDLLPDATWKLAVEQTGGRFFPAANETAILEAINEIDRLSTGQIDITQYVTRQPQFAPFAVAAVVLWTIAIALGVGVKYFRRFP